MNSLFSELMRSIVCMNAEKKFIAAATIGVPLSRQPLEKRRGVF